MQSETITLKYQALVVAWLLRVLLCIIVLFRNVKQKQYYCQKQCDYCVVTDESFDLIGYNLLRDWCVLWFIYVVRCGLCICLLWCFEDWRSLIVVLQTWKWTGLWCSRDWQSLVSCSSSSFSWLLHTSFASCTLLHYSYIVFLFSFLAVAYIIRKLYAVALFMYRLPLLFPGVAYTTSVTSCRLF